MQPNSLSPRQRRELLEKVQAALGKKKLHSFLKLAWNWIEPREFRTGWHLEALCDHLEAVNRGEIRRLLVNVPPRPVLETEMVLTRRGRIPLSEVTTEDDVVTHTGALHRVIAVHEQGELPILELRTKRGRTLKLAYDHPVLTARGWVNAAALVVGDVLAVVRPPSLGATTVTPEEARLLGYIIGDGSVKYASRCFTSADEEMLSDFEKCAASVGWTTSRKFKSGCSKTQAIVIKGNGEKKNHPVTAWLEKHGLVGSCSYTKRVPQAILNGDATVVSNFLSAYWNCDGTVSFRARDREATTSATTVSHGLAIDIQHLLLRLGIVANVRKKVSNLESKRQGSKYTSYQVDIASRHDVWLFSLNVPLIERKQSRLTGLCAKKFPEVLVDDELIEVSEAGSGKCRCLTVDEDCSFTANDIAVHNTAKSLTCSVFWPAWTWLQDNMIGEDGYALPTIGRGARFLCASYSDRLSLRDSLRTRQLVANPFYQKHYGIKLSPDQKSKSRFDLRNGGYRVATSTGGMATGEGGDILIVDDPHNVKQAESPTVREDTVRWFAEVLPTRFNDQKRGCIVVVMQRVHERDVSGYILAEELGYEHLCLPMEYEPNHPFLWPNDPRTEAGELLWELGIGHDEVETLKKTLGAYAYAGQAQQRPAPREGGLFKRHWIRVCEQLPPNRVRVRAWDLAGSVTGFDPDWTVGALLSKDAEGFIYIEDIQRFRATPGEVERNIKATALLDGPRTTIVIPQDPGSAGKAQVSYLARSLQGYRVKPNRQTGDKETRAGPFASQCEAGNVRMLRAPWNEDFLGELGTFPNGRHDDQVDAVADAFNELAETRPGVGSVNMRW